MSLRVACVTRKTGKGNGRQYIMDKGRKWITDWGMVAFGYYDMICIEKISWHK